MVTLRLDGGVMFQLDDDGLGALAERVADLLEHRRADQSEPWIGVARAAEHLACKDHRVYALVHRREIPFRKEGSRLLFRRSELDAWLDGTRPA